MAYYNLPHELRQMNFLTPEDISELFKIPIRTVHHLARTGKIPAMKVGRLWRFRHKDISDWVWVQYSKRQGSELSGSSDQELLEIHEKALQILRDSKY